MVRKAKEKNIHNSHESQPIQVKEKPTRKVSLQKQETEEEQPRKPFLPSTFGNLLNYITYEGKKRHYLEVVKKVTRIFRLIKVLFPLG